MKLKQSLLGSLILGAGALSSQSNYGKVITLAQLSFSDLLENSENIENLLIEISKNNSLYNPLNINSWDKDMLETAMRIAQKWKK